MENRKDQYLPDAEATRLAARDFAASMGGGEVLALVGTLGAGKTHFVQGMAAGLGFEGVVTSPTFSLVHEYVGGRWPLFHFDFYRLESVAALLSMGWDEYLDEQDAVVVVEWADRFPELLPPRTRWLGLEYVETGGRLLRSMPAPVND